MSQLVPVRAFVATLINGTASATSGPIDCRRFAEIPSMVVTASSVAGTADIKIQVAYSTDGVTFGAAGDEPTLIASTIASFPTTPEGPNVVSLTGLKLAPYMHLIITGTAANPADSLVTIDVQGREEALGGG